ncbi:MAG: hypothetical protein Q8Q76_06140 [Methylotenera sp.]|nr:hypothetical protein [Methylotenera sp.]
MLQKNLAVTFIFLLMLWGCSSEAPPMLYLDSAATYNELNQQVGCDSKFVEDKKSDIFNGSYLNHWMTWKGQVFTASSEEASLNLDGKGIQDLHVVFADKKGGYDLIQDEVITVKFLMKGSGGCILPFEGIQAEIIRESKS